MKKIVLTIVAMLTMTAAVAQEEAPQNENDRGRREIRGPFKQMTPQERTDKMAKDMELNDDQAGQVKALNEKYASMFERPMGPRPEGGERQQLTREEMEAKMKEMRQQREGYNNELKAIVGDEKFEKYQKSQRHMRRPGGGNRPERRGGGNDMPGGDMPGGDMPAPQD